jgi:hypothetical protein
VDSNTHVPGINAGNHPAQLSLSQTSKNALFFLLSFMFFHQQNWRTRRLNCLEVGRGKEAQIMYTHVSKCKNDKKKLVPFSQRKSK